MRGQEQFITGGNSIQGLNYFPSQKVSSQEKTEDWAKQCIEAASNIILNRKENIRASMYNKKVNYDLANNIVNEEDIHRILNPMTIQFGEFPVNIQHFNKSTSKIKLLLGEEWKRPFDYKVVCLNEDAISGREIELKNKLMELTISHIKDKNENKQLLEQKIKQLDHYMKYEYQDMRADLASKLLNYHWYEQRMQMKFNAGFEDALIAAEEIYRTDIIGGNPIFERCDPLTTFVMLSGNSPNIEDAELIIELSYLPIGKVIEEFYEDLTPGDIDFLEKGGYFNKGGLNGTMNYTTSSNVWSLNDNFFGKVGTNGLLDLNNNSSKWFGGWFNEYREVRVARIRWKSRLKRQVRTYFDEDGFQQEEIVSEFYKADKDKGDTLRTIWLNEWWEGTKIGPDIYVKIQARPVQFRNLSNPALGGSGYVGTIYNINSSKALSLMDRMKPFQYLLNIFWHKLLLGMSRYDGPTKVMPFHMKPSGWTNDQWMYYERALGILMLDPFNVATEGIAKGTLAGSMNTVVPQILDNSAFSSYIGQMIQLIDYADNQIGEISGITKQREGQISTSETVGGVERSVAQSSNNTEWYFLKHEDTKIRALYAYLETCKVAYRNRKDVKLQSILDDGAIQLLEFDGEDLYTTETGIVITNNSKYQTLQQKLEALIQVGLQSDKLNFSKVIDLYTTDSLSALRRKIEDFEFKKEQELQQQQQQQQEQAEQQMQIQQQQLQQQMQMAQEKAQLDIQIAQEKLNLEREKLQSTIDLKLAEIEATQNNEDSKRSLEEFKINLEQQKMSLQQQIDESKLDIQEKVSKEKLNNEHKLNKERLSNEQKINEERLNIERQMSKVKIDESRKLNDAKIAQKEKELEIKKKEIKLKPKINK